jgi:hypothetical protein
VEASERRGTKVKSWMVEVAQESVFVEKSNVLLAFASLWLL